MPPKSLTFWGAGTISGAFNIKYYLFSLSSLGTTVSIFFGRTRFKIIDTIILQQHSFLQILSDNLRENAKDFRNLCEADTNTK